MSSICLIVFLVLHGTVPCMKQPTDTVRSPCQRVAHGTRAQGGWSVFVIAYATHMQWVPPRLALSCCLKVVTHVFECVYLCVRARAMLLCHAGWSRGVSQNDILATGTRNSAARLRAGAFGTGASSLTASVASVTDLTVGAQAQHTPPLCTASSQFLA